VTELPTELPHVPYVHHRVRIDDDVVLAAQVVGAGPTVLVANGIGLTTPVLDFLVDHLRRSHRVICWDYRGAGRSRLLRDDAPLHMPRHAEDALALLRYFQVDAAAVVGWSMGVPVGLEMIRRDPRRVVGLAALFGSPGPPFRAAFPDPLANVAEGSFAVAERWPSPLMATVRLSKIVKPLAWNVCYGIRFTGHRTHRHLFHCCVANVVQADSAAYLRTLMHLLEHDSRDVLDRVGCPVLAVAGTDDWVTPLQAALEIARRVREARWLLLPDTSHFGPLEEGPRLYRAIDELLGRSFRPG
jgi:pimeloyl-ACP methyl ester carboxylesterase